MNHLFSVMALAIGASAGAQATDTLDLRALQARARAVAPRAAQRDLLARQSALRQRTLAAELLPALSLEASGQYQSDVPRVPVAVPGGPPVPPHDQYDARLSATQRLLDPALPARRALERAHSAQSAAALETALHATREQVNDAFFIAIRAQWQADELRASIRAIETQLAVASARVREGAALPGERDALEAERLRREQVLAEAGIMRASALDILAVLTGTRADGAMLRLPLLQDQVAAIRRGDGMGAGARPEYRHFAATHDVLERQQQLRSAQDLPRVSAFARGGYGRPGLNPLNDSFDTYWLAGIQLSWMPWTWGSTDRDREVLALQRQIVATEEAAFVDLQRTTVARDLAAIDRLEAGLAADEQIVALRERIVAEAAARYREAVLTAAEFIERETELLSARLARATRHVELEQARARLLTTLGIEVH
jgi:outer membrane protein TolC